MATETSQERGHFRLADFEREYGTASSGTTHPFGGGALAGRRKDLRHVIILRQTCYGRRLVAI
jgi:hypothetical protein